MSWRLVDATGYCRYQAICPQAACGLPRGFETRQRAQRFHTELRMHEAEPGDIIEYPDGDEGTCPHASSLDAPLPQRSVRRRTKRSTPK